MQYSNPLEIVDETFGRLSLADKSTYYAAGVPWNRGLNIQLFIQVEHENYRKCLEIAKNTFSSVRSNEKELFRQGLEHLTSIDAISGDEDYIECFLHHAAETSIEIDPNGGGQLVYLVMMLGSLIIEFSHDASFQNAQVMVG
jgi:hypothetical protein